MSSDSWLITVEQGADRVSGMLKVLISLKSGSHIRQVSTVLLKTVQTLAHRTFLTTQYRDIGQLYFSP